MSKEKGKIKIRYFEVEVDGGDQTLLEAVKSAAALANRPQVRVIKALPAAPANGSQEEPEEDLPLAEEREERNEANAGGSKRGRVYASPEIVEVDLKDGEMPFVKFVESVKPNDTTKKYLTVAVWFKRYRGTSKITIDHVWTCSRAVNWGTQKDMNQPFRDAKRQGYFKGSSDGYEVTHIGEGAIDKLLSPTE